MAGTGSCWIWIDPMEEEALGYMDTSKPVEGIVLSAIKKEASQAGSDEVSVVIDNDDPMRSDKFADMTSKVTSHESQEASSCSSNKAFDMLPTDDGEAREGNESDESMTIEASGDPMQFDELAKYNDMASKLASHEAQDASSCSSDKSFDMPPTAILLSAPECRLLADDGEARKGNKSDASMTIEPNGDPMQFSELDMASKLASHEAQDTSSCSSNKAFDMPPTAILLSAPKCQLPADDGEAREGNKSVAWMTIEANGDPMQFSELDMASKLASHEAQDASSCSSNKSFDMPSTAILLSAPECRLLADDGGARKGNKSDASMTIEANGDPMQFNELAKYNDIASKLAVCEAQEASSYLGNKEVEMPPTAILLSTPERQLPTDNGEVREEEKSAAWMAIEANGDAEHENYGVPVNKTPKSQLIEVCAANCWRPPLFVLCGEEGPPHERMFTCNVIVKVEGITSTLLECLSEPKAQETGAEEQAAEGALWFLKHLGHSLKP